MLDNTSFLKEMELLQPLSIDSTYLLAISGGADSMALLALFQQNQFSFQVAHVNYKLRGENSDLDQKIVEDFCTKNEIQFHLYEVSAADNQPTNSIQTWARKIRYQFFKEIQNHENLEFLVTAHHLNDDLETFLINLSRGSGLVGLSGIPAQKNNILRPLLPFSKKEIYNYLAENKIPFREDESNKKSDYLRNKIRNEIVPKLEETNEHFLSNFQKSLTYLQQSRAFLENQIEVIEDQLSIKKSNKIIYNKQLLSKQGDFVQFEILRKFGFSDPTEIKKIFTAETGKTFYNQEYHLLINRNELILSENSPSKLVNSEIIILQMPPKINDDIIDLKKIISGSTSFQNPVEPYISWKFDLQKLVFPIKLRHKKKGDFFYPMNMSGRKKVSKYFKDEKFSLLDKAETWLLVDGNDEILGIIPLRQDRRLSAHKETSEHITFVF